MDIAYPGFGRIVVEGTEYDHDIVIDHGAIRKRDKGPSRRFTAQHGHTPLSPAEDIPWSGGLLIVGNGYSGRLPVLPEFEEAAASHGVDLEIMGTAEACEIISGMENSTVTAVLHVTC